MFLGAMLERVGKWSVGNGSRGREGEGERVVVEDRARASAKQYKRLAEGVGDGDGELIEWDQLPMFSPG